MTDDDGALSGEYEDETSSDKTGSEGTERVREPKTPRDAQSYRGQATRHLQRARKAVDEADGQAASDYHLRAATVMALLELADAVRGDKSA